MRDRGGVASTPASGRELWASDGTPGGTRQHQDILPGPASSSPMWLTLSGRTVYFTATDGVHGFEPWALFLAGQPIFADGFESGDTGAWSGP